MVTAVNIAIVALVLNVAALVVHIRVALDTRKRLNRMKIRMLAFIGSIHQGEGDDDAD